MKLKPIGPNQTEVTLAPGVEVLHSYETPVAACINGVLYRTNKKHSVTTSRHINKWLNGAIAETLPQHFFDQMTTETIANFRAKTGRD